MARTTTRTTAAAGTRKPSLLDRLRNRKTTSTTTTKRSKNPITGSTTTTQTTTTNGAHRANGARAHQPHTTTASAPVQHHKRKVSMGDKISGAMMKLEGSLTHKPGKKAAGTRRMHGTDGRGSHHVVV